MFCKNCGTAVTGQFCTSCGSIADSSVSQNVGLVFNETRAVTATKPGAPTSGLAIAALVCALVFPLLGLILGFAAKSEIKNSQGHKAGDSLANAAIGLSGFFIFIGFVIFVFWFGYLHS
jgi:uncharacterized membrane protein YvbJ